MWKTFDGWIESKSKEIIYLFNFNVIKYIMGDEYTGRLHSVALSESDESKKISDDKSIIKTCCFKTNDSFLSKCLDWCSWLSNINCKSQLVANER